MSVGGGRRSRVSRVWRWTGRHVGPLISLASVAGVVWWASSQGAPHFPTQASKLALVTAAVGVYAAATVARGWRWHRILRHSHIDHRAIDAYALVVVGYMGNTVLPVRGGELVRTVLLGQRSSSLKREVFGSIIAERLLDATALVMMFAVVTWLKVANSPVGEWPAWIALGAMFTLAAAALVYLRLRQRGRLEWLASRARPFTRATRRLMSGWGAILLAATLAIWVLEGVVFWLVGSSLGLGIGLLDGLALVVLASFFAMIPAAPGYVGTYDAAIALGLKGLGISGGRAVGYTLLVRFVVYVPVTIVGLVLLVARYGGVRALRTRRLDEVGESPDAGAPVSGEVPTPEFATPSPEGLRTWVR